MTKEEIYKGLHGFTRSEVLVSESISSGKKKLTYFFEIRPLIKGSFTETYYQVDYPEFDGLRRFEIFDSLGEAVDFYSKI
jgi:hypothetical protein